MNRLEMAQKLFENMKLKAKNENGLLVCVKEFDYNKKGLQIVFEETGNPVFIYQIQSETWEIIEPERKLKEFDFGEMVYIWINVLNLSSEKCKSVVSSRTYMVGQAQLTLEELKGKWTIDGYYEEDEE